MADGIVDFTPEKLQSPSGVSELNRILQFLLENVAGDGLTRKIFYGYATPESAVTADIGSIYLRFDGGASTTLYVKESGSGATGWIAK